jgi:hypothetical protein
VLIGFASLAIMTGGRGSCEHDNEHLCSIKGGARLLAELYSFLKDSGPWRMLSTV